MPTVKTTVYLDPSDYRRLKALAAREGCSAAELIRTAVSEYARTRMEPRLPRSLGIAASGDGTLAERSEELLEAFGDS